MIYQWNNCYNGIIYQYFSKFQVARGELLHQALPRGSVLRHDGGHGDHGQAPVVDLLTDAMDVVKTMEKLGDFTSFFQGIWLFLHSLTSKHRGWPSQNGGFTMVDHQFESIFSLNRPFLDRHLCIHPAFDPTIMGGDFTHSWLSLPLSHSTF